MCSYFKQFNVRKKIFLNSKIKYFFRVKFKKKKEEKVKGQPFTVTAHFKNLREQFISNSLVKTFTGFNLGYLARCKRCLWLTLPANNNS